MFPTQPFSPGHIHVESAENGTVYNPQFPLFVGADCICLPRNHGGPLPELPVRDYCVGAQHCSNEPIQTGADGDAFRSGDHEIQTLASLARHMAGGFYPMSRSIRNAKGDSARSGKTRKTLRFLSLAKSPMDPVFAHHTTICDALH